MSTKLGSSTHATDWAEWWGGGYYNQFARKLTLPSGGPYTIVRLGTWATGKDNAATIRLVVWDFNTGAILAKSAEFNLANEAFALGNSNSHERDVETPVSVAGSTAVLVGYARDPGEAVQHDQQTGVTGYRHERAPTWPGSMSGYATDTDAIQAWLYYDLTNTVPNTPTLVAPANGSRQLTATPSIQFTHSDPDSDACASYDLQVSTDVTFASVTHWNDVNDTTGISGNNITRTYAGTALTPGTVYYWRARTADAVGDGAWSGAWSFRYNAVPTVAKNAPTAGALGVIHNLAELALWTPAGAEAECQFKFTPSDGDGDTLTKYQLIIYNASSGGTAVYDSGEITLGMTSGVLQTLNVAFAIAPDTERWWTIKVYDGYEWSPESSRTAFKMLWSQGLWEYDSGAGSTNWGFSSGVTVESKAILFRSATGTGFDAATGKTAWFTNIASVPLQRYLQVLVRLTTDTSGTPGTLADMTFTRYGAPLVPDGWAAT
jgi:hypothetical protein